MDGMYQKLVMFLETGEEKMVTVGYMVNLQLYMQSSLVLCQQLFTVFKVEKVFDTTLQFCILITLDY
jgi:hypothetical protein